MHAANNSSREKASQTVKVLLDAGADSTINEHEENGWTALHFAASRGDVGVITQLLQTTGIHRDARDARGRTPLLIAAENNYPEGVTILLQAGARKNLVDNSGKTLTYWAKKHPAIGSVLEVYLKENKEMILKEEQEAEKFLETLQ